MMQILYMDDVVATEKSAIISIARIWITNLNQWGKKADGKKMKKEREEDE